MGSTRVLGLATAILISALGWQNICVAFSLIFRSEQSCCPFGAVNLEPSL